MRYLAIGMILSLPIDALADADAMVSVSLAVNDDGMGVGQSRTVSVLAEVVNPASGSDGLFSYDVNVDFSVTGIVGIDAGSIIQPEAEVPFDAGTVSPAGLAQSYATYFFRQDLGIGGPHELVRFTVDGLACGTVNISVTPDYLIGGDFTLHESESLTVDYGAANLSLTVTLPGDASLDFEVDGADYTLWADHYGQCGMGWGDGDFTGNGCVDGADYTLWADNYQRAPCPSPAPEPSMLGLLALGSLAAIRRRAAG